MTSKLIDVDFTGKQKPLQFTISEDHYNTKTPVVGAYVPPKPGQVLNLSSEQF